VIFIGYSLKGNNLFEEVFDIANALIAEGDESWYTDYKDVFTAGFYDNEQIRAIHKTMPTEKFNQEYLLHWRCCFITGAYSADLV